jgi:UDP-N-acetylmuramoyl-L-alanyl-D-glutamate--2,6-diaminopimelate ligase
VDTGGLSDPRPAELTTPGAVELSHLLAAMVANGCDACAMEVSSHALDQGRVEGLEFAVAVFTNLTQDHLDYHGSMQAYAAAKAKLFGLLGKDATAVLNLNDPAARRMWPADRKVITTTVMTEARSEDRAWAQRLRAECRGATSHWVAQLQAMGSTGSVVKFAVLETDAVAKLDAFDPVELPVVGEHNVSNMLQALAAARCVVEVAPEALRDCAAVPGRLEPVTVEGVEGPAVFVDYAHTPDALKNVISALRPVIAEGGELVVVFGCGGDRDRTKRPRMAAIAATLGDVAYLTSDNPRTEDPQRILDDALAGVPPKLQDKVQVEIDRAAAIRQAVGQAQPRDTVLIAGKGHEDYQILGTQKVHFDDREHAAAALEAWKPPHDHQ